LRMSLQTTRLPHTAGSNLLVPMATFTVLPAAAGAGADGTVVDPDDVLVRTAGWP
jgi:hypothetical protein